MLQEEKLELRITLQSQEDFIKSSERQQEQLQKELANITEALHSKELLIRSDPRHPNMLGHYPTKYRSVPLSHSPQLSSPFHML